MRIMGLIFLLAAVSFVRGSSVEFPVTPANLEQGRFHFAISTSPAPAGTVFHITIKAKSGAMPVDASAEVCDVSPVPGGGTEIGPVFAPPPVVVTKKDTVWEVRFVAPPELLKDSYARFIYGLHAHGPEGQPMPSVDFYEVNLRDFVKP